MLKGVRVRVPPRAFEQKYMTITWLGQACFKIQTAHKLLIIDPYDEKIGFSLPKINADVVLMTHSHYDHSNSGAFPSAATIIKEPGKYMVDDIAIKGIQTFHDEVGGQKRGLNTIYRIESEGVVLLHMGDFGESQLRQETIDAIGDIDILMIPVGGTYTVDGTQAAIMAKKTGAKIVIPMHYLIPELKIPLNDVKLFLEKMSDTDIAFQDRLEVTKEGLASLRQEVVVLSRAVS